MSSGSIILFCGSGVVMSAAFISLLVGKTPYLGFFGRDFIARRRWEPGYFWGGVAHYVVVALILGLAAVMVR